MRTAYARWLRSVSGLSNYHKTRIRRAPRTDANDGGKDGQNIATMLKYKYKPFWRNEASEPKPKIFLSIFCRLPPHPPAEKGIVRKFLVLGSRPKEACEAQVSFVKILRILPEIHSNFVQYTPQLPKTER